MPSKNTSSTKGGKSSDEMAVVTEVLPVGQAHLAMYIVGTSPLIIQRMSEKAKGQILLPPPPKTAADKKSTLKHDPVAEFRASPYTLREPDAETFIALLSTAFKGAMGTAALDQPGVKKAQIGRLVYVRGEMVSIFGEPQIFMSTVRSADINHTPDIRTRCIVPNWACHIVITYATPLIKQTEVLNLLAAAGITAGVGDWRPEKGKGAYGCFRIAGPDDPEYVAITEAWGREEQLAAMRSPRPYNSETEELLGWFVQEVKHRGFNVPSDNDDTEMRERGLDAPSSNEGAAA